MTSGEVLDAGTYGFDVQIKLVDYPTYTIYTGFKVIIDECRVGSITPPMTQITELFHVVGTLQSSRSFADFTQTPPCEIDLRYSVLDREGKALDPDF